MAVVWLALFHYYTKISGFLAYLYVVPPVVRGEMRVSHGDFLLLLGLALLIVLQLAIKPTLPVLVDLRFYWGWVVFYLIFKFRPVATPALTTVLVVASAFVLIEAALVNTIVRPEILPNFPDLEAGRREYMGVGYYQRPYSFGASATVGASLLTVLIAICEPRGWRLWLSITAVLAFSSGAGFLALIVVLMARYRSLLLRSAVPLSIVLSVLVGGLVYFVDVSTVFAVALSKVDPAYFGVVLDLKKEQISNSYANIDWYTLIFGYPGGFRGGDFGLLAFSLSNGIFGMVLFALFVASSFTRRNALPLFLLVGTSFHYPVLFFLPGQMLFGLALVMANDSSKTNGRVLT